MLRPVLKQSLANAKRDGGVTGAQRKRWYRRACCEEGVGDHAKRLESETGEWNGMDISDRAATPPAAPHMRNLRRGRGAPERYASVVASSPSTRRPQFRRPRATPVVGRSSCLKESRPGASSRSRVASQTARCLTIRPLINEGPPAISPHTLRAPRAVWGSAVDISWPIS